MQCQMTSDCTQPVTMLDKDGYLYCTQHGTQRRAHKPCRALRAHEINRLGRGEQLTHY